MSTSLYSLSDSLLRQCAQLSRTGPAQVKNKPLIQSASYSVSRVPRAPLSKQWSSYTSSTYSSLTLQNSTRVISAPTFLSTLQSRQYARHERREVDESSLGERAAKTYSRHTKNQKKRKEAAGRAFQDVKGYGDMLHGLDSGMSTARAMRKAQKLQPKHFTGKVAMYFANTSTAPDPIITEETLESMPSPNSIRTVKSVKATNAMLGGESTDRLVDFVSEKQSELLTPTRIQSTIAQMASEGRALPVLQRRGQDSQIFDDEPISSKRSSLSLESGSSDTQLAKNSNKIVSDREALYQETEEDLDEMAEIDEFEDDDEAWDAAEGEMVEGEGGYAPRRVSPDVEEDLSSLSTASREAIEKVRSMFQGSLSWYQPQDGEMSMYVALQQEKRKSIPSQRTALTSANATSVRNILGGTKSAESRIHAITEEERMAMVGEKQKVPKATRAQQPKAFFDYTQIQTLASREFAKAKRVGKQLDTPLKDVAGLPQICVVGRSNVGKSSLLNSIMGPNFKTLRVSKTPGRTQQVQMLVLNDRMVVADTPGYGYAAATPKARKDMEHRIGEYLSSKLPRRVYILVDARRGLGNADIRLADSLEQLHTVYQIVLTKVDKKQPQEQRALIEKNIQQWVSRRGCAMNEIIKTSSRERSGIDQLRLSIYLASGFKL